MVDGLMATTVGKNFKIHLGICSRTVPATICVQIRFYLSLLLQKLTFVIFMIDPYRIFQIKTKCDCCTYQSFTSDFPISTS